VIGEGRPSTAMLCNGDFPRTSTPGQLSATTNGRMMGACPYFRKSERDLDIQDNYRHGSDAHPARVRHRFKSRCNSTAAALWNSAAQDVQAAINEPVAPPSRLLSGSAASALPRLFCAPAQSSGSESGRLAISPP